jgi:hypothetical protein
MTNEEAIKELKDASDSEVRYGDIKHHHDEVVKRVEAFDMAIEALKKSSWVPITYRDMTEEEKNEFTVEGTKILNCPLPDDGAEVLITTEFGNVFMDVFHNENGDCYFEDYEIEDARAWMPLPKPYRKEADA